MRVLDHLPRVAKLSRGAARQAGSLARSAGRAANDRLRRRLGGAGDETGSAAPASPPAGAAPDRPTTSPEAAPPAPADVTAPPSPAPAEAPAPASPPAEAPAAPEHVDREVVLVAESADPGAAGGAGAQIRVDEPWDGYGELTAKQAIGELADRSPATLALARLYETSHRNRRTVLAEIDRRLEATEG